MALDPIKLGSATSSGLMFETGSRVTTSDSGIQSCSVKALSSDGANIFNNLPAAGTPFSTVFGTSYLPASFLVDYTDSGPEIEYLEGKIARVTFNFKRQDPTQIGVRKIFVDSTINYESPLTEQTTTFIAYSGGAVGTASGGQPFSKMGFPDPVVTVRYNSNTRPNIGSGGLTQLYALPGSSNASGFPAVPQITIPVSMPLAQGTTVTYFNGTAFVTEGPLASPSNLTANIDYRGNPLGWQLIRLKSDPVAGATFYDVQEEWRNTYFVFGVSSVNIVP